MILAEVREKPRRELWPKLMAEAKLFCEQSIVSAASRRWHSDENERRPGNAAGLGPDVFWQVVKIRSVRVSPTNNVGKLPDYHFDYEKLKLSCQYHWLELALRVFQAFLPRME